jgi:hypothetical protein
VLGSTLTPGIIERPVEFTESPLQELSGRLVIQEDRTRLSLSGPLRDEIDYPADHDRGNVFRTPPGWAWWATTGGAFP